MRAEEGRQDGRDRQGDRRGRREPPGGVRRRTGRRRATAVKYTGKIAVMIVVANAEFAQSYIAQARSSRRWRPSRFSTARQNVFRAIHSRIRESTTT